MGGELEDGIRILLKYFGNCCLIEVVVVILAIDWVLLFMGILGIVKIWVFEYLAVVISGNFKCLVQGIVGMVEEFLCYGWNYVCLLFEGFLEKVLVFSLVMVVMQEGCIVWVEELICIFSDVQDVFIIILFEKVLFILEFNLEVWVQWGFNLIVIVNDCDWGVNELFSVLCCCFNIVSMFLLAILEEEVEIVW